MSTNASPAVPGSAVPKLAPLFVKTVELPAVELLAKRNCPWPLKALFETKFWVTPELLTIPTPLIVSKKQQLPAGSVTVIVKGLAPILKMIPLTFSSSLFEIDTDFKLLVPKVAASAAPLGTVAGIQLLGSFQLPFPGCASHDAEPA